MQYSEIILSRNYDSLTVEQYEALHPKPLTPIPFRIDVEQFNSQIFKYKQYLKQWGPEHAQFPRYGLPIVNLTGNIDDNVDPSCAPLDTWWEHTGQAYWDHDFTVPTEILSLPCFDPIESLKPYMLRSNILWWDKLGHFKPHIDALKEHCVNLRVWGTNRTDAVIIFNGIKYNFEPGQLYLIDTTILHEAHAVNDFTCTFFFSLGLDVVDVLHAKTA